MRKKASVEKHNTKYAILFVLFVFTIILISAVLKVSSVIRQSKFDGSNRFTISISNDKNIEVVSFSPIKNSVSILTLNGEINNLNIGQLIKIPIDGYVKSSSLKSVKEVSKLMSNILLNFNKLKTNLNFVDILRLFLASKTIDANNISTYTISFPFEDQKNDKIVNKLFKDEEIEKENLTIEIINTTNVGGLGSRLARLISNMGGNVIQVSTQSNSQNDSIILYNGKKNYTTERLSKVLDFRSRGTGKKSIAEITIIIGENNRNPLSF